jgi:ferredoxin
VKTPSKVLVVDPTACDGHGVCAELFPEWVTLDRWGYPMISGEVIPANLVEHAERAVIACPRLALHLVARPTELTRPAPTPERSRSDQGSGDQGSGNQGSGVNKRRRADGRSGVKLIARSSSPAPRPERPSR